MPASLNTTESTALRPVRSDDRQFAQRIARREPDAIIAFRAEFAHTLDAGFASLVAALARSQPPGCRARIDALVPHVAGAAGEGFLKRLGGGATSSPLPAESNLAAHVPALAMSDLFHASACLARDDAACLRFIRLVDDEIGPPLIRRFRQRLSPGRCEQIVQDVLSQAWSAPRAAAAGDGANADGLPVAQRRLERYLGLSALKTWLYSMGFRMLQDETRSQRDRERSLDADEAGVAPASREAPPDEQVAERELQARFRPRLSAALHDALQQLLQRPIPRLGHVAYLWLPCRIPQVAIADLLGVSKARISQQVKEIIDNFAEATADPCRELSADTGIAVDRLAAELRDSLAEFFPPVLEQHWLAELRRLQSERPPLLQLAYLAWREQVPSHELANQLGESAARVAVLMQQLEDWRESAVSRIAQRLHAESRVPVDLLEPAARTALAAGFSTKQPDWRATADDRPESRHE